MIALDPHASTSVVRAGASWGEAAGVVIMLHGRGASASDILSLADELGHKENIAYLAPEATGYTWYPLSFLAPIEMNQPYLSSALDRIRSLVEDAVLHGVAREKIIITGFSQGACLATEFVARNPARYGGLIAFTGGLIGPALNLADYAGELAGTPTLIGAGDPDLHVPWERVQASAEILKKMGADVTLRHYKGMPHTINTEEIELAKQLIVKMLATGILP